jgi:hypothetical protein
MSQKRKDGLWRQIFTLRSEGEIRAILNREHAESIRMGDRDYQCHVEVLQASYRDAMADMASVEW